MSPLEIYVQGWRESTASLAQLLPTLHPQDWARQTDCPDWTVKDVLAHLAHLEDELVTGTNVYSDPGAAAVAGAYTQAGVDARRDRPVEQLIAEFTAAVALRSTALDELPDDPHSRPPVTPGGIDWSWDTLLRNRTIDVWVHEQDIRRAIDRSGGFDSAGARVTIDAFKQAMPFVIGKKVRPAPGSSIGWQVTGAFGFDLIVAVGADGRAKPVESADTEPDVRLSMTCEEFAILGAGRRTADRLDIAISGDATLGQAVLAAMAITF